MTNLPVPVLPTEVPGNFMTSALQNTIGVSGLGFSLAVPAAYLYQGTTQSFPNNTATAVSLDSSGLDTYGGHSNVTNNSRYVAQQPGTYAVWGTVAYTANATGVRESILYKNGGPITGGYTAYQTTSGISVASGAFTLVTLNGSTDYVEVWANHNAGAGLNSSTGTICSALSVWWMHS